MFKSNYDLKENTILKLNQEFLFNIIVLSDLPQFPPDLKSQISS